LMKIGSAILEVSQGKKIINKKTKIGIG